MNDFDFVIKGGRVIDPASKFDNTADVYVKDGKVAYIVSPDDTRFKSAVCGEVYDAAGLTVTPGFVDIHMHEDKPEDFGAECSIFNQMLRMGVTSCVGGNCGENYFEPLKLLDFADLNGLPVNVSLFIGATYLRQKAGAVDRYSASTASQLQAEVKMAEEALAKGACGVSFGVRYVPGCTRHEIESIAKTCVNKNKTISAHVRDDAANIIPSIKEIADITAKLGLNFEVSHIGSMAAFGQMDEVLSLLDSYNKKGISVLADCYPYDAFSTEIGSTTYDEGWTARYNCGYDSLEFCSGKYKGMRADKNTFCEMRNSSPEMLTVCHVMKYDEVIKAITNPYVVVASDGILDHGQGHPRASGTFPEFLKLVRENNLMSLSDAVSKITYEPALRIGLQNKGRLSGGDADICVFDSNKITSTSDFFSPLSPPKGIRFVFVNGVLSAYDGKIICGNSGRSVRS